MSDGEQSDQVVIDFDEEASRLLASVAGEQVGFLAIKMSTRSWSLYHTEVDSACEGFGVGSALVRAALAMARDAGVRVRPTCPFVAAYLKRHPEHHDIVHPADLPRVARA